MDEINGNFSKMIYLMRMPKIFKVIFYKSFLNFKKFKLHNNACNHG